MGSGRSQSVFMKYCFPVAELSAKPVIASVMWRDMYMLHLGLAPWRMHSAMSLMPMPLWFSPMGFGVGMSL